MKLNPLISIIIPTFNDYSNLVKNIELIKKQEFKDYEIIIINDCSTDNTENYLSCLNDEMISHHNLKENKGPGYARNIGIKFSKGDWISFLDSDDYWMKERLNTISNFINNNSHFELICHNEYKIDEINNIRKRFYYGPLNNLDPYKDLLMNGNRFSTSATVVKKTFLQENKILFNENKKYFSVEDYDFWLKCIFHNANFVFLKSFLGNYKIHENNITKNILKHKRNYLRVIYNHVFYVQNFENNKILLWKNLYIKYNCELAVIYLKYFKNVKKFLYLFLKCFKKNPTIVFKFIINKILPFNEYKK